MQLFRLALIAVAARAVSGRAENIRKRLIRRVQSSEARVESQAERSSEMFFQWRFVQEMSMSLPEAPSSFPSTANTTAVVTLEELAAPTASPIACASNQGMFGEVEGDSTTVSFAYELEVSSEDVDIETEVLPELEQAIIDSILPEAFPDECGADGSKQQLAIAGVSQDPMDSILEEYQCSSTVDPDNTCVVVLGELTLYSDDIDTVAAEKQLIQQSIKGSMDSGNFDDAQEDIARVSYIESLDETSVSKGASDSLLLVGLLVAGSVVIAILVFIAYKSRGKTASV